ncbi:restriction endonuclease [Clostridium estertheticum]|uniref:Restriction endonuclease n=1 Tax=Clostridium estertheticum TaxID=238834 RepID=A0AA47I6A4_9CLOT|nr:restriction endonuclease [Clostridium estertheticum]MBU3156333.1 restriction endonuclease [Clostridium estertheticum]WAG59600.1 restriction endonuclease [Clostridium estertheticum]
MEDVSFEESEKVWECDTCRWWEHSLYSYMDDQHKYQQFKDWENKINSAILKKFGLNSKEVTIITLRKYISENNDYIYNIKDKKMEELVASVFKEHYNCDVRLVEKSNDGGVDLILIQSGKSTIVQVKRRTVAEKVESVKEIGELLGATMLAESRNCIFVTTVNHFSKDAIKSKQLAISKEIEN